MVEQPANRTGGDLVVDGTGLLARLVDAKPSTVPDLLAADLSSQLEKQGFRLAKGKADDAPVLRTEIRRWEPYSADYSTVTVDIDAALVEPGSGRELWSATRTGWMVRTSDARSRPDSFMIASATIAEALLAGWEPAGR